jgi:hypothetical protein
MFTIANIQKLVSAYLGGQDIEDFAAKFADVFYDIENTGDPAAIQLSYTIESLLANIAAGFMSEAEFKNAMHGAIPSNSCVVVISKQSSSQWVALGTAQSPAHGYIVPLRGFGLVIAPQGTHQSNKVQIQSPQVLEA